MKRGHLTLKRKRFFIRKALAAGDVAALRKLIASDAKAQRHCFHLLVRAAESGNVAVISTLLAVGIDRTREHHQPFRAAFYAGHLSAVQILFGKGFDFSELVYFKPASWAAVDGRPDLLDWALQNGPPLRPGNFELLYDAFDTAVNAWHRTDAGYVACIKLLLDRALPWQISQERATEVASELWTYEPCRVAIARWLAKQISRW